MTWRIGFATGHKQGAFFLCPWSVCVVRMSGEQQFSVTEPVSRGTEQLQQQEQVWFAWVCRLHELHSRVQTPHSAAVLGVARRRWTEARRKLDHADAAIKPGH